MAERMTTEERADNFGHWFTYIGSLGDRDLVIKEVRVQLDAAVADALAAQAEKIGSTEYWKNRCDEAETVLRETRQSHAAEVATLQESVDAAKALNAPLIERIGQLKENREWQLRTEKQAHAAELAKVKSECEASKNRIVDMCEKHDRERQQAIDAAVTLERGNWQAQYDKREAEHKEELSKAISAEHLAMCKEQQWAHRTRQWAIDDGKKSLREAVAAAYEDAARIAEKHAKESKAKADDANYKIGWQYHAAGSGAVAILLRQRAAEKAKDPTRDLSREEAVEACPDPREKPTCRECGRPGCTARPRVDTLVELDRDEGLTWCPHLNRALSVNQHCSTCDYVKARPAQRWFNFQVGIE